MLEEAPRGRDAAARTHLQREEGDDDLPVRLHCQVRNISLYIIVFTERMLHRYIESKL